MSAHPGAAMYRGVADGRAAAAIRRLHSVATCRVGNRRLGGRASLHQPGGHLRQPVLRLWFDTHESSATMIRATRSTALSPSASHRRRGPRPCRRRAGFPPLARHRRRHQSDRRCTASGRSASPRRHLRRSRSRCDRLGDDQHPTARCAARTASVSALRRNRSHRRTTARSAAGSNSSSTLRTASAASHHDVAPVSQRTLRPSSWMRYVTGASVDVEKAIGHQHDVGSRRRGRRSSAIATTPTPRRARPTRHDLGR